jgi:hypothetical protein
VEGPREFLDPAEVDFAPPDDVEALAAGITRLAARMGRRERIAYDMARFERAAHVAAVEAFYREAGAKAG